MRYRYIYHIGLLFLGTMVTLGISCNNKPTQGIVDRVLPEITGIDVSLPDPVQGDTLHFRVMVSEEMGSDEYDVAWQIEDEHGEIKDSTTKEKGLLWIAPTDTGTYQHTAQLVSTDGEQSSNIVPFSVHISVRENPEEMIVFSGHSEAQSTYQIYTLNVATEELTQLTEFDRYSSHPVWNPYGTEIVFTSEYHPRYIWIEPGVWMMDFDGENKRQLLDINGYEVLGFNTDWSPDGKKIAADFCPSCEVGFHNYTIYGYDIEQALFAPITIQNYENYDPSWNVQGTRVAYVSTRDYVNDDSLSGRTDLYISTVSDGESSRVTYSGNIVFPIWSTNESQIAVRVYRDDVPGIYLINIESGERELLVEDISKNKWLIPYAWNPEGNQLLVGESDYGNGVTTLYKLEISTKSLVEILTWKGPKSNNSVLGADWYVPE